jgi:hypothetical protein
VPHSRKFLRTLYDEYAPGLWDLLRFFDHQHLPAHLQDVVEPFDELASRIAERVLENEGNVVQTRMALEKLLEAKDCAVRALVRDED